MFVAGFLVTYFGFIHMRDLENVTAEQYELFLTYNSLNVIVMTIPCFMLAKAVNVTSERFMALLANLTKCGFGVYMVHFFLTGPSVMLVRAMSIPIPLQIPCAAVVAFAASWIFVALVYRIFGKGARWFVG
jgi:surface polysaccharide O-acyltransferase-like enzyme